MNHDLQKLHDYPFQKLAHLKSQVAAPDGGTTHISLSIGEPKHPPPEFVLEELRKNLSALSIYPNTKGSPELRQAIADWLGRRYQLKKIDPEHEVLPVNGTREALFSFAQAVVDRSANPLVISPNPFYQIYEGATLLAGAELGFTNCWADNAYLPDYSAVGQAEWQRCQLLYLCSPGNPSGAVMPKTQLQALIELAHRYDFVIASDECYSEIYFGDNPPTGLLQASQDMGNDNFSRCVVFHSLSKRSNLPGLRSGFVAGDASVLKPYLQYRTYHGCAMSQPVQLASVTAWNDEHHVVENRRQYEQKFTAVIAILQDVIQVQKPDASFYLWLRTPFDELTFTQELYSRENVTVLPGSFLSRPTPQGNPGERHVRIALVANLDECIDAAHRLKRFIVSL
jgi:N-succinyldiaminopimelate aminotransferase